MGSNNQKATRDHALRNLLQGSDSEMLLVVGQEIIAEKNELVMTSWGIGEQIVLLPLDVGFQCTGKII